MNITRILETRKRALARGDVNLARECEDALRRAGVVEMEATVPPKPKPRKRAVG